MTAKPRIRVHKNGRISFPGVVEYRIASPFGRGEVLSYPPTAESHPAPNAPRSSLPFYRVELDREEFARLNRTGWIRDPRHTGHANVACVDNRRTA